MKILKNKNDYSKIKYGEMMTPGLVINENLKSSGIIPKEDQLLKWLKEN